MNLNDSTHRHMGSFRVESGELRVTDPCYCPTEIPGRGGSGLTHGDGILRVPALNGLWHLSGVISPDGRVAQLHAFHEGTMGLSQRGEHVGELYVDSGQMGVFDDIHFPRDPAQFEYGDESSFYKRACNLTWSDEDERGRLGGCLDFGGVTSSGYGDGSYPGYVQTDSTGLAVAVTVTFIGEEEDEEEDWDDDSEDDDWDEESDDEDSADDDDEEPDEEDDN